MLSLSNSVTGNTATGNASFGCRLMGVFHADADVQQQALLTASRSLKDQAPLHFALNDPSRTHPVSEEYWNYSRRQTGNHNQDGFGVVSTDHQLNQRSTESAGKSAVFSKLASQLPLKGSLLGHIRVATVGPVISANTHPFTYGPYTFAHNGSFYKPPMSAEREAYIRHHLPDAPLRKTDSDSKRTFYYFLATLQDRYHTLDPSKIGTPLLTKTFTDVLQANFNAMPDRIEPLSRDLEGPPVKGWLDWSRRSNAMLSFGDTTLAAKHGYDLYLSYKQEPNGLVHNVVVASEPPSIKDQQWITIPDNHVLVIEHPKNKPSVEMTLLPWQKALNAPKAFQELAATQPGEQPSKGNSNASRSLAVA